MPVAYSNVADEDLNSLIEYIKSLSK